MHMHSAKGSSFYGVTTVGSKGQVVIPAEARTSLGLQPGDKVIVFGKHHPERDFGMVCICPISSAEQFVEEMTQHLSGTQAMLKLAKEKAKEKDTQ